ncbi:GSCOCT00004189001.3-RA-CDS [Cotesia congregata]|uniref:Odorant receptor n=1 Tax=Cotesia congregata TaxID=51543 RepID=A0A8J2MZ99_COTCN|nr:GSCOCT00004189001.3-RA-CDS [Cotesia congregata]CAG5109174.1 olfactory receptor 118 [Cotesia congregata]
MAKNGISDYRAFHDLTKRLLTVGGLWPYSNSNILYRLLPYIQIFLNLAMALVVFGFVLEHFSNVAVVTRGLSSMTSFASAILKVVCLIRKHKEITELHKNLDPYFEKLLENEKMLEHILKKVNIFRLLSGVLTLTVFAVIAFQIIAPLIFIINCKVHHVEIKKYPLIYPGNYPWNIPTSGFLYLAHFTLETFGTFALFFVTTSVDSLFTLYSFQIIGQLREMSYYITHIDSDDDSGKYIFHSCIIQYQKLIKCVNLMEAIYGPVVLWMMGTNAIVLCALLFQISKMKTITIIQGFMFTSYVILKLVQTFMYAWSGSCLTEESENYKDAVYSSNWQGKKPFMVLIVMCLSQRPLAITACNFSIVSLRMFISVVNTTISYFFLLQTLDSEQ